MSHEGVATPRLATARSDDGPSDEDTLPLVGSAPKRRSAACGQDRGTLLVVDGCSPRQLYEVSRAGPLTLGRGESADVRVDQDSVSRLHARIQPLDGRYFIEDLGSVNGTLVNGRQVSGRRELKPGDLITLGRFAVLRFDLHSSRERRTLLDLERLAVLDPLTGLLRRAYFDERLEAELGFATRRRTALAVVMIDIDHFKQVNDRHGHLAGDAVLRVVAQTLRRMLRPEDIIGRYGGDELIVAARETDERNATILAERIRRVVEDTPFAWEGDALNLTISLGVSAIDRGAQATQDALVSTADAALYDAKRTGRNRVISQPPPSNIRDQKPERWPLRKETWTLKNDRSRSHRGRAHG